MNGFVIPTTGRNLLFAGGTGPRRTPTRPRNVHRLSCLGLAAHLL